MAIEKVLAYFETLGIVDKVKQFEVSSATVALAAQALGCEPARIAKSLTFKVNDTAVMVVCAGDVKVDNATFKAYFGTKPKMLTPEEVDTMIGHSIGGVCPFAINEGVVVVCDESLKRFETVFPACGSANSAIELTPEKLFEYAKSTDWVDVCKLAE